MSEIGPVAPIVLSTYVTTSIDPYKETVSRVKHTDNNGTTRVESVDYIRYNREGQLVKPEKTIIDISI